MKKIAYILSAAVLMVGCSKAEQEPSSATALQLGVAVEGYGRTKAELVDYSMEDYFSLPDMASATVYLDNAANKVTYQYSAGKLAASAATTFYFPTDGSDIATLTVDWPGVGKTEADVAKDQSTRAAFLTSDWLRCIKMNVNLSATVPITMKHLNAKLVFAAAGLKAGEKIASLKIGGYTAYCDDSPAIKTAQLMLLPATAFSEPVRVDATFEGDATQYTFFVENISSTVAGSSYTVELPVIN